MTVLPPRIEIINKSWALGNFIMEVWVAYYYFYFYEAQVKQFVCLQGNQRWPQQKMIKVTMKAKKVKLSSNLFNKKW